MRLLMVGAGGIGGFFGARFAAAGIEVPVVRPRYAALKPSLAGAPAR